jgi:hypothetical protein
MDGDVEAAKQKLREGEAWREKYLAKWGLDSQDAGS